MRNVGTRTIVLVTMLVVLGVGSFALLNDAFRKRQIVVSTPMPSGIFSHPAVKLNPGQRLCLEPVTFPTDAGIALVTADQTKKLGTTTRLLVTVRAGSKRQNTIVPTAPRGTTPIAADVPDNPTTVHGNVCVRNVGPNPTALLGTDEPRFQTATKSVGPTVPPTVSVSLALIDSTPQTLVARFDNAVTRASQLSGGLSPVLLWLLLGLVIVGIPVMTITAMVSSFDRRD